MNKLEMYELTDEEKGLLVKVLFDQEYATEVVISQINDIERGERQADEQTIKNLNSLYDRLMQACR